MSVWINLQGKLRGRTGPVSNKVIRRRASVPAKWHISICPTALAGCTSVTNGQIDGPCYGNICCSSRCLSAMPPSSSSSSNYQKTNKHICF